MKIFKLFLVLSLFAVTNVVAQNNLITPFPTTIPKFLASPTAICPEETARKAITKLAADDYIFEHSGGVVSNINTSKNDNVLFGEGYFQKAQKGNAVFYYSCKSQKAFAVWGDIMEKWGTAKWETGKLGWPISNHTNTPKNPGAFTHFQGGSIYWSDATGSHIIKGSIRSKWGILGKENSELGFPTSDELVVFTNIMSMKKLGICQQFEYGKLYQKAGAASAFEVRGLIYAKYLEIKENRSFLGWATSDETAIANTDGRQNNFEFGAIVWSPATNAKTLSSAILKVYNANGGAAGKLGFPTGDANMLDGKAIQEFQKGVIWGTTVMLKEANNPQYIKLIDKIKILKPIKIDDGN